jgi:hypothetical protein
LTFAGGAGILDRSRLAARMKIMRQSIALFEWFWH